MLAIRADQITALEQQARSNFKEKLANQLQTSGAAVDQLVQDASKFGIKKEAEVTRFATALTSKGIEKAEDLPKPAKNALLAHGVPAAQRLTNLESALDSAPTPPARAPGSDIGAAIEKCPLHKSPIKPVHWIEIELIGEDGSPIGWEEYLVKLPDGTPVSGYLDGHGLARIENIEQPGTCSITFPRLDRRAWDRAAAGENS